MKLLSLTVPGNNGSVEIEAPAGVPSGGLSGAGGQLASWIINLFLVGAVVIALGYLVYGGIMWTTSGGDKTKVENARKTLIYAVIGLVICFLAFFIVSLFGQLFGVKDFLNAKP